MSALDRLEVKLSLVRHVRDTAYWKLPYGTVIIPHPDVADIGKSPVGSKILTERQVWAKVGQDQWVGESTGEAVSNVVISSRAKRLALPLGTSRADYGLSGRKRAAAAAAKAEKAAKAGKGKWGVPVADWYVTSPQAWAAQHPTSFHIPSGPVAVPRDRSWIEQRRISRRLFERRKLKQEVSAERQKIIAEERAKKHALLKKIFDAQAALRRPLTDDEYAQRTEAIDAAIDLAAEEGLKTEDQFRDRYGVYDKSRQRLHEQIVATLFDRQKGTAKQDREMLIAGGLGGSGKTTVLTKPQYLGIDTSESITINPDDVKKEMAKLGMIPEVYGLSPMERAALVHEESGHIANLLLMRAESEGYNIIQDITMSSSQTIERRMSEARAFGYKRIRSIFVDIPVEESVKRALTRHRSAMEQWRRGEDPFGGRYVPPWIIRRAAHREHGSINLAAFKAKQHDFTGWQLWDNSGAAPVLVEIGGEW